jgi:hypothetical protein
LIGLSQAVLYSGMMVVLLNDVGQVGSQISTIDTVLYSTNVAFSLTLPPQKHTKPDQPTPTQCETHLVRRTQAQTQTQKREAIHDAHTRTGHSARQRNGTERRGYNRVNWCKTWTILRSGRNRKSTGRNNKLDVVRNYLLATTTVSFVLGMLTCRSATKPAIDLHGVDKQKRTSAIASSAAGEARGQACRGCETTPLGSSPQN